MKLIRGILKFGFITQGIVFVVVGLLLIYPTAERVYNAYLGGNLLNEAELIIIVLLIAISMWFLSTGFITLYIVAPLPFFLQAASETYRIKCWVSICLRYQFN